MTTDLDKTKICTNLRRKWYQQSKNRYQPKNLNAMKNQIIALLVFVALINTQCNNDFETISLENHVYINLPSDFFQVENSSSLFETNYKSKSNSDELYVLNHSFEGINSLTIEMKENMVESNLEGFVESINGLKVKKQILQTIDSMIQNEYSMEIEKNDSLMTIFTKVVNKNSTIIILSYFTPQPTEITSIETKERIFNSKKID